MQDTSRDMVVLTDTTTNKTDKKNDPFHTTTSVWNSQIESVVKEIGENCQGYRVMNLKAASKSSSYYNIITLCMMILGPLSGIMSTILLVQEFQALQILVTAASYIVGVCTAYVKFRRYEQRAVSHKAIAARYASLEGNIRRQLALPRQDRANAGEYLEWVSLSFEDTFNATPMLEEQIYAEWVQFAKSKNMSIPKELGKTVVVQEGERVWESQASWGIAINHTNTPPESMEDFISGRGEAKDKKDEKEQTYDMSSSVSDDKRPPIPSKPRRRPSQTKPNLVIPKLALDTVGIPPIPIPIVNTTLSSVSSGNNTPSPTNGIELASKHDQQQQQESARSPTVEVLVQSHHHIRQRSATYQPIPELARYTDSKMKYELTRLSKNIRMPSVINIHAASPSPPPPSLPPLLPSVSLHHQHPLTQHQHQPTESTGT